LIKRVSYPKDLNLLEIFLESLTEGKKTFRYFNTREFSIIKQHEFTFLKILSESIPIAYGHLEFHNSKLWLGIAVSDYYTKQGHGKMMLQHLLNIGIKHISKTEVYLSLDKDNFRAKNLYSEFGFSYYKESNGLLYMKRKL
jgi:RimJ/RimL family protein N-acetyltransferase